MKQAARDLARFVVLRETVARVARAFATEEIPTVPLKGALLVVGFLREPCSRPVGDVDLLVPADRFEDAIRRLQALGGRIPVADPDERTVTFELPGIAFPVDVHKRLFRTGLYRVDEGEFISRARRDSEAFGESVLLLEPEDAFAHVVGHHAGRQRASPPSLLADDLAVLAPRIRPFLVAERLEESGLRRALAFAAWDLRSQGFDVPLIDDLLARLPPGRVDELAVALARVVVGSSSQRVQSLGRHLTNTTFGEGARSLTRHLVGSARHASRLR